MRRVLGFLCLVEITSGILQGYYTPILTDIARHLGIHDADVNWFEAAQLMVSALAVPLLAKLGDMFGHRRILLVSTVLTAAASWGVALAPDFSTFLAAWALQGFYVVWLPLEIAIIFCRVHQLPDGAARTRRAAGLLVGALEFGVIAGALAAGALVEVLAGQLQLVLMVPAVAVTACLFAIRFGVPESTERSGGRVDTRGFSLLAVGLLLITSGLTFMRLNGPGAWWPWALVAAGILVFSRSRATSCAVTIRWSTSGCCAAVHVAGAADRAGCSASPCWARRPRCPPSPGPTRPSTATGWACAPARSRSSSASTCSRCWWARCSSRS